MENLVYLSLQGFIEFLIGIAKTIHSYSRIEVQIALTLRIIYIYSISVIKYYVISIICM